MTKLALPFVIASLISLGCSSDKDDTSPGDEQSTTDPNKTTPVNSTPMTSGDLEKCAAIASDCKKVQQGCKIDADTGDAHCELCAVGQYPEGESAQCESIPGNVLEHDFETITLAAGEEHSGWCRSWVLNNSEELWVNTVEFISDGLYHHSNWFFLPEGQHKYPKEEFWDDCYNQGFDELAAAIQGGVLFAQSTQVKRDIQKFPNGAAVRIPPYSRIMAATHVLNYTTKEASSKLKLRIHTLPKDDVKIKLAPFRLTYRDLLLPAGQIVEHGGSCDIKASYDSIPSWEGTPYKFKLFYVLPHYHQWGHSFKLSINGGPKDGETLFELGAFGGEPFGRVFDPPVDLSDAKGLNFSCGWNNTEDKDLKWGLGEGEMCVMLGFAEYVLAFDGTVSKTDSLDESGDIPFSTGKCNVMAFTFSQEKEGGDATE